MEKQILSQEYEPVRININTDDYPLGFDTYELTGYWGKGDAMSSYTTIRLPASLDLLHDDIKDSVYDDNTHMYSMNLEYTKYPSRLYVIKPIGHNGYISIFFYNKDISNEDLLSQIIKPMLADIEYEPCMVE